MTMSVTSHRVLPDSPNDPSPLDAFLDVPGLARGLLRKVARRQRARRCPRSILIH
jgi:hypothetical protein